MSTISAVRSGRIHLKGLLVWGAACAALASLILMFVGRVSGQTAGSPKPAGPTAAPKLSSVAPLAAGERAVLDRYWVTCHNDKLKTANLSPLNHDLANVGDHPELWEKVVRKLRAGLMPPPGVRRPPLPEYEALRIFWKPKSMAKQRRMRIQGL